MWARVAVGCAAALIASPLVASWTVRGPDRDHARWWVPGRVSACRWALVAVVGVVLAALAAPQAPWLSWWIYSQAGTGLAVIDVEHHRLPNRLVYPLAGAELVTLAVSAGVSQDPWRLLHATIAAIVIGGCWLAWALASPAALGLGDVRLAALGAALLGWRNWLQVVDGQAAVLVCSLVTAVILALARPARRGWRMAVPMGPALIAGTVLVGLR